MVEQLCYAHKELPSELKCQVLAFLRITWPEGFTGPNRLRDWISRPEFHPVHLLLVDTGVLIAHTEVLWKYLDHAGTTYKAYGLSGVFSYPAFRGQGFGERIVRAGTAYIDASDGDIGIFHCAPELARFYARAGWTALEGATTLVGDPAMPETSDEVMMVRFLSTKGEQAREAFTAEPLYFGPVTW